MARRRSRRRNPSNGRKVAYAHAMPLGFDQEFKPVKASSGKKAIANYGGAVEVVQRHPVLAVAATAIAGFFVAKWIYEPAAGSIVTPPPQRV